MSSPIIPDIEKGKEYINAAASLWSGSKSESNRWLAIGNLALAEIHLAGVSRDLMGKVREGRHMIESGSGDVDFSLLLGLIDNI